MQGREEEQVTGIHIWQYYELCFLGQKAKETLAEQIINGMDFVSKQTFHRNRMEPETIRTYDAISGTKVVWDCYFIWQTLSRLLPRWACWWWYSPSGKVALQLEATAHNTPDSILSERRWFRIEDWYKAQLLCTSLESAVYNGEESVPLGCSHT